MFWQLITKLIPGLSKLIHYKSSWLRNDITAGLSVAAVALPVGIAYADLAGVPPVIGMYSAIFPLFAYALFGSSKQLMTGPDAATCIIVAASLGQLAAGDPVRYQALLVVLTLCTGIVYLIAGMFRLGFIANFLSLPILSGFLNGIAIVIIVGQVQKMLGYRVESNNLLEQVWQISINLHQTHFSTLILALSLIITMLLLKKFIPKLPSAFIVVILGIALVQAFNLDQQGIAILGEIPKGMPTLFSVPELAFTEFKQLLGDAIALTLISFTSGILTAKSFAQRNRYSINPNQELIGFGACNIASGLVQGFPVTGADSRTAVNNDMGGKSQLVGIVAGGAMLLVLFFFTQPLAFVPISALAAVIMVSAFGLFDFTTLRELYRMNKVEFGVSILTTIGVLVLGALPGVIISVALSLLMLLAVSSKPQSALLVRVEALRGYHSVLDYPHIKTVPGLLIYRFEANILFFNADFFKQDILEKINSAKDKVHWVVIDANPVSIVDSTAVRKVIELREQLKQQGINLYIVNQRTNVQRFFDRVWVTEREKANDIYQFNTLKIAERQYKSQFNLDQSQ